MAYTISSDGQSITCKVCGMTSHNKKDVQMLYCGHCHIFHVKEPESAEKISGKYIAEKISSKLMLTDKQQETVNWLYQHCREPMEALTVGCMLAVAKCHPDYTWWDVAAEAISILKGENNAQV